MSDVLRMRVSRGPQRLVNRNVVRWEKSDNARPNLRAAGVSRGATRKAAGKSSKTFIEELLASPDSAKRRAVAFTKTRRFAGRGVPLAVPVRELDAWLVERKNRVAPALIEAEAIRLLGGPLPAALASARWINERQRVFDSLIAAIVARAEPAVGTELTRLLLIFGLIESLAPTPSAIRDEDDVENALRYRTVVVPKDILALVPERARLARRYGFADLYVVRDEWNRYEAGEIAHIENVLPHESKKRALATLSETEVTTTAESETINTEEYDSQTTDRMELQQHGQRETDLGVHVAAQVEIEASYGPMHIAATVGGSFDYSQKDAEEHAFQQSHEMITRAVKRVEERVKTSRATRALQRTTEKNTHALQNETTQSVVGIYRWVDKVQRMQLFRYPHRLLLEFEIPEPAAYLTWRRSQPRGDFLTPEPIALIRRRVDFTPLPDQNQKTQPLQPNDITESNYQWWVSQYNVMGVSAPPAERVQVTLRLELKEQVPSGGAPAGGGGAGVNEESGVKSITDKSVFDLISPGGSAAPQPGVTIPQGYRLDSWEASGYSSDTKLSFDTPGYALFRPIIHVMVGQQSTSLTRTQWDSIDLRVKRNLLGPGNPPQPTTPLTPAPDIAGYVLSGSVPATRYALPAVPVTGVIQVTAQAGVVKECLVHVTLQCRRTNEGLARWQQQTYEQISAAYWGLKRQRADEMAAQATGAGVEIKGDPPARNKEVIVEELKRGVIEMLTGQEFLGRDAMQNVVPGTPPKVDLDNAIRVAEEIQFIEQAFEWENLTYVLYPYFWADYERWPAMGDISLTDPDFARFLRSGSARVVVPARPKFENQVRTYVDFGAIWGGGPVPTVDDPEYLSIAAEIVAQQSPPDDGEKRRSWEVRLPTTLVWLDNDSTLPKTNPLPKLDQPPGVAP